MGSRQATTRLAEPLGARVVVDVVSRAAVPVTSGHPPSWARRMACRAPKRRGLPR